MEFISSLKDRNALMFWFSVINLVSAAVLIFISFIYPLEFKGVNAWYKPIKFALSTAILCATVGWFTGYLEPTKDISFINWTLIVTLAFEVFYITFQASKGQASHYNLSTPYYSMLYSLMAIAASAATLAVGYLAYKFFTGTFTELPIYYLWSIRLGIILFVIFSFEGFAMGAALRHAVGGEDGTLGLPFLNWSVSIGDLRVAHFIGMHALQILPLMAYYFLKDTRLVVALFIIYTAVASFVLIQALRSKPLIKLNYENIK